MYDMTPLKQPLILSSNKSAVWHQSKFLRYMLYWLWELLIKMVSVFTGNGLAWPEGSWSYSYETKPWNSTLGQWWPSQWSLVFVWSHNWDQIVLGVLNWETFNFLITAVLVTNASHMSECDAFIWMGFPCHLWHC